MEEMYYGDLIFDNNFIFATTKNNKKIKFTKYERALLTNFASRPGKLLSRSMLLDFVVGIDKTSFDRNIDYLISRLRRKLGDSAGNPLFIATQYGEGYIWIAKRNEQKPKIEQGIYFSIGPIYGLEKIDEKNKIGEEFVNDLKFLLRESLGSEHRVELIGAEKTENISRYQLHYTLELSFLMLKDIWTCSLVTLNQKTGQVFDSILHTLPLQQKSGSNNSICILVEKIKEKIWNKQIFRENEQIKASSDSLVVGLYKASMLFEPGLDDFSEVEKKLRECLRLNPQDHYAAILLATNLHIQMYTGNLNHLETREKEIEVLVLKHLPYVQNDALYLSAAAERLYGQGHHDLGELLAYRALDLGPSYAACYLVIGRIKVLQGDIYEGISYYEKSIEMSKEGDTMYILLQTMKCIAYLSLGEHEQVRNLAAYIIKMEPEEHKKIALGIMFLAGDREVFGPTYIETSKQLPVEFARYLLEVIYHIGARLFHHEKHRENLLKGPVNLFYNLHGCSIVPEKVRKSIPRLYSDIENQSIK